MDGPYLGGLKISFLYEENNINHYSIENIESVVGQEDGNNILWTKIPLSKLEGIKPFIYQIDDYTGDPYPPTLLANGVDMLECGDVKIYPTTMPVIYTYDVQKDDNHSKKAKFALHTKFLVLGIEE